MPIYEYVCESCGELFAKLQKMGAGEGEITCQKCGSVNVKRRISGCSIGGGGEKGASSPVCGLGGG